MASEIDHFSRSLALALAAMYEHQDMQGYLDLFHPAACLNVGTRVVVRAELTADRFTSLLEEAWVLAQPDRPPGRFEVIRARVVEADNQEGHLVLDMREAISGRSVVAHAWVRRDDLVWRLMGICMPREHEPTPVLATLPLFVAAELLQAETVSELGVLLLTPFDVAFHRHLTPARFPLVALEESRFTCQNSGHCCESTMRIGVSEAQAVPLLGLDWARHDSRLDASPLVPSDQDTPWKVDVSNGKCQLRQDHACTMHATVGFAPISICSTFPVGFTATPSGVRVWTSFTCPTVRANLGERLVDRHDDLAERYRIARHGCESVPDRVFWWPDGPTCLHEDLVQWEAQLLEVLANHGLSLVDRLEQIRCMVHEKGSNRPTLSYPTTVPAPELVSEAKCPFPLSIDRMMAGFVVARNLGHLVPDHAVWSRRIEDSLDAHWPLDRVEIRIETDLVSRYLRQVLFRQLHLDWLGVVGHVHRLLWVGRALIHIARFCALVQGRTATNEGDWSMAVSATDAAIFHQGRFLSMLFTAPATGSWLWSPDAASTWIRTD